MKSRLSLLLALAVLSGAWSTAMFAQPAPGVATRDFWIYAWNTPKVDGVDTRARVMAEAGFTVINAEPGELETLVKHGLKGMVHTDNPAVAKGLASNAAVWGYHLGDEPFPEAVFPGIGERFKAFRSAAPRQVPFVNMLSTTGEFLRSYMAQARPPLLSFDYYQWWWGSDRYFEKLEQFREAAIRAGVPLAACFEVSANPGVEWGDTTRLADNDRKLRQSVYTSLAYGVTGVEWFHADMIFTAGSGALTPVGRDVAAINKEILPLGRVLAPLASIDVFHTAPFPAGTRSAPKEHWVQTIAEDGRAGFVTGLFRDSQDRDYVLVANRDYREAQNLVMKLQSKWLGIAPWYTPEAVQVRHRQARSRHRRVDDAGQLVVGGLQLRDSGRGGRAVSHHHHGDPGRQSGGLVRGAGAEPRSRAVREGHRRLRSRRPDVAAGPRRAPSSSAAPASATGTWPGSSRT